MKSNLKQQNDHDSIKELLPWYVTGSLSENEVAIVKQHLSDCAECREDLSACRNLAGHPPETNEVWGPSPVHFSGILNRIDELETTVEVNTIKAGKEPGFLLKLVKSFSNTPRSVQWTLALETAACFGLLLTLLTPLYKGLTDAQSYQTLSSGEEALKVNGVLLRVMFADDLTTGELAVLLKQTEGQIRQGAAPP